MTLEAGPKYTVLEAVTSVDVRPMNWARLWLTSPDAVTVTVPRVPLPVRVHESMATASLFKPT